jgi:DNA-binding NarL/FixJ family response regulator
MIVVVYSQSDSFRRHITQALTQSKEPSKSKEKVIIRCRYKLEHPKIKTDLYIIHMSEYTQEQLDSYISVNKNSLKQIVIADDRPNVRQMLDYTSKGFQAYCNAYMASAHYLQLCKLLRNNQSWYPPHLLSEALTLAHQGIANTPQDNNSPVEQKLDLLTPREREIAYSVAEGKSNKLVASEHGISERTVKAHLTHIFEKLPVTDRVSLVIYLKNNSLIKQ